MVTSPALILTMLAGLLLLAWQASQSRGGGPAIRRRQPDEPESDALYDEELWRGP